MMNIDKIRDEMAKKNDHPGVTMIGEYVTERVTAGAAIPEGKTLEGAFAEIRKYAEKHKTGNFAFVPPAKAYEIVDGYFGFEHQPQEDNRADFRPQYMMSKLPAPETIEPIDAQAAPADDLDLDALLGEW